jgi:cobalt-zinc-cadmium resistance protein CzcA
MTASIAIISLMPMLFASGTGSEIQKPLAIVVIGGLITSTLLTLLIIPSVYSWFEKKNVEVEM